MWKKLAPAVLLASTSCVVQSTGDCKTDADCLDGAVCQDGVCRGGETPTAKDEAPATAALGSVVTLDGSGSTAGAGVRYEWTVVAPAGVTLGDAGTSKPTFTASIPHAAYEFELVVVDRGTRSAPAKATVQVSNSTPVARLAMPSGPFRRSQAYELDASTSSDPDSDALTYDWRVETTGAGFAIEGTGAKVSLKTGALAAAFKVTVTVSDSAGASHSAEATGAVDNVSPVVSVPAPFEVEHNCSGAPGARTCKASSPLNGSVADGDNGQLVASSIGWRLKSSPPAAASARVEVTAAEPGKASFEISAADSVPLAGAYEFELTATDDDGATSKAAVVVTVGNRVPVVSLGGVDALLVPHAYDAAAATYTAAVPVVASVTDPDGDPVSFVFDPFLDPPQGVTFALQAGTTPGTADYVLTVPAASPTSLISGTTPIYSVGVRATDVNGGVGTASRPVVVTNRPPAAPATYDLGAPADPGHSRGSPPGTGLADQYFRTYVFDYAPIDPDGDPLDGAWSLGAAPSVVEGSFLRPSITTYGPDSSIVNARVRATATVTDPFGATATGEVGLVMGNRLPVAPTLPDLTEAGHVYGTPAWAGTTVPGYGQTFTLPTPATADPDGDAAIVKWSATCAAAPIKTNVTVKADGSTALEVFSTSPAVFGAPIVVTAILADGLGETTGSGSVRMGNRQPVGVAFPGATSTGHSYGVPAGTSLAAGYFGTFDLGVITPADPDGDPVSMSVAASATGVSSLTAALQDGAAGARTLLVHSPSTGVVGASLAVTTTVVDLPGAATTLLPATYKLGNRAPVASAVVSSTSTGHSYGVPPGTTLPAGYYQTFPAPLSTDPDGDPISVESIAVADSAAATATFSGSGATRSILVHTTVVAVAQGDVGVSVTARDPFGAIATSAIARLRMGNRAPVVKLLGVGSVGHTYGVASWRRTLQPGYYESFSFDVSDPDGDALGAPSFASRSSDVVDWSVSGTGSARTLSLFGTSPRVVATDLPVTLSYPDALGLVGSGAATFVMGNRPPLTIGATMVSGLSAPSSLTCTQGTINSICTAAGGTGSSLSYFGPSPLCVPYPTRVTPFSMSPTSLYLLRASYTAAPIDPDGDPVTVTIAAPTSTGLVNRFLNTSSGLGVAALSLSCSGAPGSPQACPIDASVYLGTPSAVATSCGGIPKYLVALETDPLALTASDLVTGSTPATGTLTLTVKP